MNEERFEELTEELMETIGKMRKELLWTRIFNGVLSVLMLGGIIVGGVFIHEVQKYGEMVVDYVVEIEEYMADVEPVLEQLAQVDVEAINDAIEELDVEAIKETFAGVDAEKLEDTITRMDEIMDSMDGASEKLQEMTQDIKNFFGWSD